MCEQNGLRQGFFEIETDIDEARMTLDGLQGQLEAMMEGNPSDHARNVYRVLISTVHEALGNVLDAKDQLARIKPEIPVPECLAAQATCAAQAACEPEPDQD